MQDFELDVLKENLNRQLGVIIKSNDLDLFKSWSTDLQRQFPNGAWRTISGAKVFINNGKVIAGLDSFNGMIDDFFKEKEAKEKTPEKKTDILHEIDKVINPYKGKGFSHFAESLANRIMDLPIFKLKDNPEIEAARQFLSENGIGNKEQIIEFIKKRARQLSAQENKAQNTEEVNTDDIELFIRKKLEKQNWSVKNTDLKDIRGLEKYKQHYRTISEQIKDNDMALQGLEILAEETNDILPEIDIYKKLALLDAYESTFKFQFKDKLAILNDKMYESLNTKEAEQIAEKLKKADPDKTIILASEINHLQGLYLQAQPEEAGEILNKIQKYQQALNDAITAKNFVSQSSQATYNIKGEITEKQVQEVKEGVLFVNSLCGNAMKNIGNTKSLSKMIYSGEYPVINAKNTQLRAYYDHFTKEVVVGKDFNSSLISHEIGHFIEDVVPLISRLSISYLKKRTKGQKMIQYHATDNEKEMVIPDGFPHAYMGKIYKQGRKHVATEILSMGLQYCNEDMANFVKKDQQSFEYTMTAMRLLGDLHGENKKPVGEVIKKYFGK